jgi:hypothetical protein
MLAGVYMWTNLKTGVVYIGKSKNLEARKSRFLNRRIKKYGGAYINRARLKYMNTPEIWEYKVLSYCSLTALNKMERHFIQSFIKCGYSLYNLTRGGDGISGYRFPSETVDRMKRQCRIGSIHNKTVVQKDLHGNVIAKYHSTREAEDISGINHMSISLACRGVNCSLGHKSHNYLWYYEK